MKTILVLLVIACIISASILLTKHNANGFFMLAFAFAISGFLMVRLQAKNNRLIKA